MPNLLLMSFCTPVFVRQCEPLPEIVKGVMLRVLVLCQPPMTSLRRGWMKLIESHFYCTGGSRALALLVPGDDVLRRSTFREIEDKVSAHLGPNWLEAPGMHSFTRVSLMPVGQIYSPGGRN
ncbi:hypothetical protein GW17_00045660 [Ensete ventricosum]|nr:hypothetical protein GW17_00045660 [Ensete ventricosum]